MKDNIVKKIKKLTADLNKWNREYYIENKSSVDDVFFDNAMDELIKLEKEYPEYKLENSPTNNVGAIASSTFEKVKHSIPMLSLNKANDEDELLYFFKQVEKVIGETSYTIEPKIDGLSISIIYKDGSLEKALTRGDGITGEDVTANILQISSIPKTIDSKIELVVRGEVYLPISEWSRINKQRLLESKEPFANPRNTASGTLRQNNPLIVKERNLSSFIFQAIDGKTGLDVFETQEKTFKGLKKLNFNVTKEYFKSSDKTEIYNRVIHLLDNRESNNFEIDGVVVKVNENKFYDDLGYTSKFPKWAIAYKPAAEIKETKLIDIQPAIGRTGKVTYVAILEPVELADTIVRRATLHNFDYISTLDLRIGDIVQVKKAGEIIPKVISSIKNSKHFSNKKYIKTELCPTCEQKLTTTEGEVDQYCVNDNCPSRIKESLIHFASRDAMNIEGLSEKQITKFIELKIIRKMSDIYRIKVEDLTGLEGYQSTSINKLLESIEKSKSAGLSKLLFALGIRHIGKKSAKELAKRYLNINSLLDLDREKLIHDSDFGDVKTDSLISWFSDESNINLIKEFIDLNLKVTEEIKYEKMDTMFSGKTIVITGTIEDLKRDDVKEYFESLGAKVTSTISSKTDYLIVGKSPSDKKIKTIENDKIIEIKSKSEIQKLL